MNRYKYIDIALIVFTLFFMIKLIFKYFLLVTSLMIIFKVILVTFLMCLFFYEKTKNLKSQLNPQIQSIVLKLDSLFIPFFKFTSSIIKPIKIGQGVMIDLSQLVVITIILVILIIF